MSQTPEQIEADIERQREQLAATIDQLGAKLDVKSRVSAKVADLRVRATTADGKPRPEVLALAGAAMGLVVAYVVWRRS
jgi:Protein of unknown function (DUF3618)